MSQIGTLVSTSSSPPATGNPFNTATAFMVGLADSVPTGPVKIQSLTDFVDKCGPRSSTNANLYDAVDAFLHEGGSTAYVSVVEGPSPVKATVSLVDASSTTALTVTADSPGVEGNEITVSVAVSSPDFTITVTDALGNEFVSPSLSTNAAAVTWAATTGVVTMTAGAGSTPEAQGPLNLAGGTDDRTDVTITHWETALAAFGSDLGPGQVMAPGQTNATLAGIWSALATHAQSNNRIALCDMDDGATAGTLISDLSGVSLGASAGYTGFWAGSLTIPGVLPGTVRTVPWSPVIAALCARADQSGNPNQAAAGQNFPLLYATGFNTIVSGSLSPYSDNDISKLNDSGINVGKSVFGALQNYGFASALSPTTDEVYSQLSASRMRMAIQSDFEVLSQPFVFGEIDGQGSLASQLNAILQNDLQNYYAAGALYGATASDAFSVNTGSTVNTPATAAAHQLLAVVSVRISPFAQLVDITLATVPVTQAL